MRLPVAFIFIGLPLLAGAQAPTFMPTYQTEWNKADSLAAEGLPKSALTVVDQIYARAKAARNYPQVAKAAMHRMAYRTFSDEADFATQIRSIRQEITDTPEPARSVLQSVLAETYWRYYQQNRYKFYDRTAVKPAPADKPAADDDPRTWDARRLFAAIATAYEASLRNVALLQKTPLTAYDVILNRGDADARALRPTLYDVLAHRAISYFQNTEPDVIKPVFQFSLDQPKYLAGPETFGSLTLTTRDSLSGRFHALQLYQQLTKQHLANEEPLALADVDNLRLQFVHRYSVVANKDSLYEQTLSQQIARHKNTPAEADYLYQLSFYLAGQGDQYRPLAGPAHKTDRQRSATLARDLMQRYPNTLAGRNAESVLKRLMSKVLTIQAEEVTEPDKPFRVLVNYRNMPTIFYRLYKLPVDAWHTRYDNINYGDTAQQRAVYRKLLTYPLAAQGQTALPDDGDLQMHTVEMPVQGVPVGHYILLVTTDGQFTQKADQLGVTPVTMSQLGYMSHKDDNDNAQTLYVTDRQTGQPLAGVQVALVTESGRTTVAVRNLVGPTDKTNATGRIDLSRAQLPSEGSYWFRLTRGTDILETDQEYSYRYTRGNQPPKEADETKAVFFTDRAIYRPGQTIYFKGLVYSGKVNSFSVTTGQETDVFLLDVNSEEVGKMTLTTNEFGTISGTFTTPTGRLTGEMTIGSINGRTTIRVEEYKRPTFAVTVEPNKKSFKLEQTVTLSAVAKTLAGAVVDGAQVRYRVTRSYYRPYWEYWRKQPYRNSPTAEIANGDATTDDKGVVRITFPATADRDIPASENPRFTFAVTLDVTDRAGETRSATQTLRIGYSALQAELTIPPRVGRGDAKPYAVRVTNQSGEVVPVQATTVVISRLQAPDRPLRERLWERPDRQLLTREAFVRLFPSDLYDTEDDPTTWPATLIKTTTDRDISVADLTPGQYYADATVTDSTGETAKQRLFFAVTDSPSPSGKTLLDGRILVKKSTTEPGDSAEFLVGTGQLKSTGSLWVLMSVEENHRLVRQEWLNITGKPLPVLLPVSERQRGGFAVNFALVQQGRFYSEMQPIAVPFTNKQLTVETQTFRDKLNPGQPEEWTLKITGPAEDNVLAELVATLYDASLDQFVKHDWETNFYTTYSANAGWGGTWQSGCFGLSAMQRLFYRYQQPTPVEQRHYDQLINLMDGGGTLQISVARIGNTIRGRVVNARGQGVPGVSVLLTGTKKGTVSDKKGNFSLNTELADGPVRVRFVMIGYVSQEVDLGKNKRLIQMPEANQLLEEVVAVGYDSYAATALKGRITGINVKAKRAAMPSAMLAPELKADEEVAEDTIPQEVDQSLPAATPPPALTIRKNFNETAFFFPQLQTDAQGAVLLKFTMPEALTRWHLMAFAHTKDLKTGLLTRDVVTQKELMITANAPRFLREGDILTLSARVNNLTDRPLNGSATLTLFDALTGKPADGYGTTSPLALMIAPGVSTAVSWTLAVPKGGPEAITLRLTAQAGAFSDGEERTIPVLPNRMLVTDTQPFWVNGNGTSTTFKLLPLTTLSPELPVQHERLTVEVTSNPAWYALQSLPYLMEYRYECAEQLFSRVYANSLAAHILNSRPAFRQVVDAWQRQPPKSPLQTNEELKAITLENTPWLADAQSETERTARLGQLFNQNQLASEQRVAFDKLAKLQTESGGFTWFGGMEPSLTMTLHILGGFGHLNKLGVQWATGGQDNDVRTMTDKAVRFVDAQMMAWMADKKKLHLLGYLPVQYLYVRSFYLNTPIDKALLAYLTTFISTNWLKSSLQSQAMAAIALGRFGNKIVPTAILKSVRERATLSDELGLFWPENRPGLFWEQAPVETQACLIEAFDEVAHDQTAVDNAKRWLLRQKQTQSWSSTKATTEAIYALLLRGSDWLNTTPNTTVLVGGQSIESRVPKTDVATGYQKVVYAASEIKPELGVVQISKPTGGPAWGAAYWQHFEPLDQVKPSIQATEAGLSVQKTLFVQTNSPEGPVITPITVQTRLKPGDLIKVRVVLKTDRLMEYIHLKDSRASGFEPVAVLSGYRYQNGLGYYEAPRDASTDFFISSLSVGTHVFEYDLRVAQTGDFSAGVATVQCFYAPEFSAHSAGERVKVK